MATEQLWRSTATLWRWLSVFQSSGNFSTVNSTSTWAQISDSGDFTNKMHNCDMTHQGKRIFNPATRAEWLKCWREREAILSTCCIPLFLQWLNLRCCLCSCWHLLTGDGPKTVFDIARPLTYPINSVPFLNCSATCLISSWTLLMRSCIMATVPYAWTALYWVWQ